MKKKGKSSGLEVNPYSAGIDFRRQNLTSLSQILTSKVDLRTVRVKIFIMNRKELAKTFMMISN